MDESIFWAWTDHMGKLEREKKKKDGVVCACGFGFLVGGGGVIDRPSLDRSLAVVLSAAPWRWWAMLRFILLNSLTVLGVCVRSKVYFAFTVAPHPPHPKKKIFLLSALDLLFSFPSLYIFISWLIDLLYF